MGCCASRNSAQRSFQKALAVAIPPIQRKIDEATAAGLTHVSVARPDPGLQNALAEHFNALGYTILPTEKTVVDREHPANHIVKKVWRFSWAPIRLDKELGVSFSIKQVK